MSSWTLDPAFVRRSPQESAESAHRQGLGTDLSDDVAQARSQRLLSDAKAALRFALALRDSRAGNTTRCIDHTSIPISRAYQLAIPTAANGRIAGSVSDLMPLDGEPRHTPVGQ